MKRYSLRKGKEGFKEPLDALMSGDLYLTKKENTFYCKSEKGCISLDAANLFYSFARLCAKDTKEFWENLLSPIVLRWLNTGDEKLRQAVSNEVHNVWLRLRAEKRYLLDHSPLHYAMGALYGASCQPVNVQTGWQPWHIVYMVAEDVQWAFKCAGVSRRITWEKQNRRLKKMIEYRLKKEVEKCITEKRRKNEYF